MIYLSVRKASRLDDCPRPTGQASRYGKLLDVLHRSFVVVLSRRNCSTEAHTADPRRPDHLKNGSLPKSDGVGIDILSTQEGGGEEDVPKMPRRIPRALMREATRTNR